MLKRLMMTCLVLALFYEGVQIAIASSPQRPFPQHVTYAQGTIEPNARTKEQMDDDVRAFYDFWKEKYLARVSGDPPRYCVLSSPGRTVSEGQGYGMILVAIMAGYDPDAQSIFDGLWLYAHDHPSRIDRRLMAWEVPEGSGGEDSAFDGDADIAYALILADAQWKSGGDVNYRVEALTRITAILESEIGPQSHLPTLGDWVEPDGNFYNQYTTRSSDFMPAHFRAFWRFTRDATWKDVITASQGIIFSLQNGFAPRTGLLPDFIEQVSSTDHAYRPADPNFLEGPHDRDYYYNAGRDPWRIATDALLNNDEVSMIQARRIADWIAAMTDRDPENIRAGYHLNGTPISGSNYFTTFFVAPLGVALMTKPEGQQFLNDIYNAVYNTHEGYYEDSVTLLCLLVMTGNYWDQTVMQRH